MTRASKRSQVLRNSDRSQSRGRATRTSPQASQTPRPARRHGTRQQSGSPASHRGLTERTCRLRVLSPPYGASAVIHTVGIGTRKQDKENANSFSSGRRGSLLLFLPHQWYPSATRPPKSTYSLNTVNKDFKLF